MIDWKEGPSGVHTLMCDVKVMYYNIHKPMDLESCMNFKVQLLFMIKVLDIYIKSTLQRFT